jgi:hypothetical protein
MFPNKVISVSESIIWKSTHVLKMLQESDLTIPYLWMKTSREFEDINQFILCMDALFVLGKVEYNNNYGVLTSCLKK